jgi:hypothetical protein
LVFAAIERLDCPRHEDCRTFGERAIAELCEQRGEDWARAVDEALFALHLDILERKCWPDGWQPADLARAAAHEIGAAARLLQIDLIAAQLRTYAPATIDQVWHDQLARLDAWVWWQADGDYIKSLMPERGLPRTEAIGLLVRLLSLLAGLPRLGMLTALPGAADDATPGARGDAQGRAASVVYAKLLARARDLLAKAESTSIEAEAEAFTAAAQAMMARHCVDEAQREWDEGVGGREDDSPGGVRLDVEKPHPEPKAELLRHIAEANRCQAVWSNNMGFSTVIGYRADVAWVEPLYNSLLVQAANAMAREGTGTTAVGAPPTRAFRTGFFESFALRIGERLLQTTRRAEIEALEYGNPGLQAVLSDRMRAVNNEVFRVFPWMVGPSDPLDGEGWLIGSEAADLAAFVHANVADRSPDA